MSLASIVTRGFLPAPEASIPMVATMGYSLFGNYIVNIYLDVDDEIKVLLADGSVRTIVTEPG